RDPINTNSSYAPARLRVRAALRADWLRPLAPLARTAFRAELRRAAEPRCLAADRACFDKELRGAARWPSFFNAAVVARERLADGLRRLWLRPLRESRSACALVLADTFPLPGGGSFTPARRAFDQPIAIAWLVDAA